MAAAGVIRAPLSTCSSFICFPTVYCSVTLSSKDCSYFSPNRSAFLGPSLIFIFKRSESESELFTGDTSKDNHSPGPVDREVSP